MPVMVESLREALAISIQDLISPITWARGMAYHREGRVETVARAEDRVEATVRGSMPYKVELWLEGDHPGWSCSCPFAEDGSFCKHAVAVAATLGLNLDPLDDYREDDPDRADIAGYVASLEHGRLVELVLEQASSDRRLRHRLEAEAAAASGENLDIETWHVRIDAAFEPYDEFVPYREAGGWASGVGEVIDAVADLIDVGHPDGVIGLAEYAHRRADEAVSYVDDSDGWLSGISERLGELHHQACVAGSPDPVALAGRLVEWELTSELDAFHRAALRWADVLGSDGIDEYRRLVEPKFVELTPDTGWSEGFAVRQARVGVALAAQDPDELIAVYRNQLNTPDAYLEVTRTLAASERREKAIEWARSGLEIFADRSWQTPPLRDFLAGLLHSDGATEQAIQLYWDAFRQHPSREAYRRLGAETSNLGSDTEWPARAVEWLQSQLDDGDVRTAQTLVEILLYEGDDQAAWETARQHGCDQRLWLALARTREEDHPLDAVEVYEREVYIQIDTKKNRGYQAAVELLERIQRLTDQTGQPDRFQQLVVAVRAEHGRKRNLIALMEKEGW